MSTVVSACLVFLQGLTGTANCKGRSDRAPAPSGAQGPRALCLRSTDLKTPDFEPSREQAPQPAVRLRGRDPLSCPVCCPVSLLPAWFSLYPSSSMTSGTARVSLPLPGPRSFCFLLLQGSWAAGMTPTANLGFSPGLQSGLGRWGVLYYPLSNIFLFLSGGFLLLFFQSVSYYLLFNVYIHMSVTILTFTDLWINCTIVRNSVGGGLVGFLVLA